MPSKNPLKGSNGQVSVPGVTIVLQRLRQTARGLEFTGSVRHAGIVYEGADAARSIPARARAAVQVTSGIPCRRLLKVTRTDCHVNDRINHSGDSAGEHC